MFDEATVKRSRLQLSVCHDVQPFHNYISTTRPTRSTSYEQMLDIRDGSNSGWFKVFKHLRVDAVYT